MIKRLKKMFWKMVPHSDHKGMAGVNRDWAVILMVFVIITLGVIVVNVRLFMRIDKGELFVAPDTASTTASNTIDEELLGYTLEFFEEKEDRFEKLKGIAPHIPNVR